MLISRPYYAVPICSGICQNTKSRTSLIPGDAEMVDFLKAVLGLQPQAWLMLFGMFLILVGVLGTVPISNRVIIIDRAFKVVAITLGIMCLTIGTWIYSRAKFNSLLDASLQGPLTPPAQHILISKLAEYGTLVGHKAIAVSDAGHAGLSGSQATAEYARLKAWAYCTGFAKAEDPCRVVMVDDEKIGKW